MKKQKIKASVFIDAKYWVFEKPTGSSIVDFKLALREDKSLIIHNGIIDYAIVEEARLMIEADDSAWNNGVTTFLDGYTLYISLARPEWLAT